MRRRSISLTVERLEDRCVPATFGNPWPDAPHLTMSFVPDGAQATAQQSALFQTLNKQLNTTPGAWQLEILRAFQTWAVNGNINVSIVADGGQPLGSGGMIQGDSRFGDIRVAASSMSANVVALSQPFDVTAGTWAGDLTLNTAYTFGLKQEHTYDVYSIALHEAGHVLGLPETDDPASPMFGDYSGIRSGLSQSDIDALQVLYGARQADRYEGSKGNDTFDTATSSSFLNDATSSARGLTGDLTSLSDVDYYRVTPSGQPGPLTVRLQTTGVSSVLARLTLYDNAKNVVDSVFASNPLSGDLSLHVTAAQAKAGFYVKVEGASKDIFGIGSYQAQVRPDSVSSTASVTMDTKPSRQISLSDSGTANLGKKPAQTDPRFDYAYKAVIEEQNEVDFYALRGPKAPAGMLNTMTVMVWSLQPGGLDPMAAIFDASKRPIQGNLLVHENNTYVLQIPDAPGNTNYFIGVRAANPAGTNTTGGYFIGVDFGAVPIHQQTLLNSTLSDSTRSVSKTFAVIDNHVSHFVLSASGKTSDASVQMTVVDQDGKVVFTLGAQAGQTVSATLMLAPGAYTFTFTGQTKPGAALPNLAFQLRYNGLSDPIAPYVSDPTMVAITPDPSDWWTYAYYATVLDQFDSM